jgi:lipoate-protein ligase A
VTAVGWHADRRSGSAETLHRLDWPDPLVPTVWRLEVDRPALVLGSTQKASSVDLVALVDHGFEVAGRRSGGGAVLLVPGDSVWLDVFVPRGHPRWDDDIGRSFGWLGAAWAGALRDLGVGSGAADEVAVHEGALVCGTWGRQVCFAALGFGEVTIGGAKAVGLSQRRTRAGARFQCVLYRRYDPAPLGAISGVPPADLPPVATVDRPADDIESALLGRLTDST